MKITRLLSIFTLLGLCLTACSPNFLDAGDVDQPVASEVSAETSGDAISSAESETWLALVAEDIDWPGFDEEDLDTSLDAAEMTRITLNGTDITVEGEHVTVIDTTLTITAAGTYQVTGSLSAGQILVDTQDKGVVRLIFNGIDITCSTNAPVFVKNADKVVITLAEGTDNLVTDGSRRTSEEGAEPDAAVFSNDDLTINGTGSLTVNGNQAHGIASDDDLKIVSGTITVNALKDGIRGRDSIAIRDGVITVEAGSDGLQVNNDVDAGEGSIFIEDGIFEILAENDGIQAETILAIRGGVFSITTGGGSASVSRTDLVQWGDWDYQDASEGSDVSAKGLKTGLQLLITGGVYKIDSADDALHSNNTIQIEGGGFTLASGDDGVHADTMLEINGGDLEIVQSYEGLESAAITIHGGTIHLAAFDDGINGSSGNTGGMMGGRPGGGQSGSGDSSLVVNSGVIVIDAEGDGIDINGMIEMTDGLLIVNGPTGNQNGAFDYMGSFDISGGCFIAVGSSGMAEAPSLSSTQPAFMYNFDAVQAPGTLLHVESSGGEEILTFIPSKAYQSVVVSSPEFKEGESYVIFTGGSVDGDVTDGLYEDSAYIPGTLVDTFTFSEIVMSLGNAVGGRGDFMGGQDGMPEEPGGRQPGGGGRHP